MRHGITSAELRDAGYTHPTSTEAFNDVLATIVRADWYSSCSSLFLLVRLLFLSVLN
ncbi:hypothetical protein [Streptomyces sp. YGL11-2]|uniref:hypothetical protein n=1 Tax=Streptomyces sp. YGL11-2 TaxID=3414028 RepID=UPI003CFB6FA3